MAVSVTCCFWSDAELARWGDLEIVGRAAEHGVTIDRHPIGDPSSDAIARVREVRHPSAVETDEQVLFVQAYERHIAKDSQLTSSMEGANR